MPRKYKILLRQGSGVPTAANWDPAEPAFDPTAGRLYVKGTTEMVEFSQSRLAVGTNNTGGGSATLALTDADRIVYSNGGQIVIPADNVVDFPISSRIWIYATGSGSTSLSTSGLTIHGATGSIPSRGLTLLFKLAANTWQRVNFVTDGLSPTFGGVTATTSTASSYRVNSITSISDTTLTLTASHNGAILGFTSNSAITITIPTGLNATFSCSIIQQGTGQITITPASGVTRNAFGGATKTAGQYAVATLIATASNTFILGGQVVT
jgi:hypothetical protein